MSRFRRDNKGVTAIEFAIVGPIFMTMMFFSMETGVFFFKQNWLKHVMHESSRFVQTGQLERAGNTEEALRNFVCQVSEPYIDCTTVDFDVKRFAKYADVTFPDATFDANGRATNFAFDMSGTGPVVGIRMSMKYDFSTKLLQDAMMEKDQNAIALHFTVARNEPKILTSP
ncbi:MAG: TadE/TadG family type IV pilus assembly protein [Pseudomonadota bacterium]